MRYCRLLLVVFICISSLAVVKAANDSFGMLGMSLF